MINLTIDRKDYETFKRLIIKYDVPRILRILAGFELQRRAEALSLAKHGETSTPQQWKESANLHDKSATYLEVTADEIDSLFGVKNGRVKSR